MRRQMKAITAALLALATVGAATACSKGDDARQQTADGLTKVNMIMEWPVADAFWTPFLVAKDKGYYKQAGIDLTITPPPTVADTMKFLGTSQADVAFTTSLDVLFARDQDAPVIATGSYGGGNNWGLIAKAPFDLAQIKGKTVGIYNDAWSKAQLSLMLNSVGLKLSDVQLVTAADDTVPLLLQDKVDIITGVTNAESSEIRSTGGFDPFFMPARDHGAPNTPVFVVAGNTEWLDKNPDLARAFMSATIHGLNDAVTDPAAALAVYKKLYPSADMGFVTDAWQTTVKILEEQQPPLEQSNQQWEGLLQAAVSQGLVKSTGEPSSYWTNDYLPK